VFRPIGIDHLFVHPVHTEKVLDEIICADREKIGFAGKLLEPRSAPPPAGLTFVQLIDDYFHYEHIGILNIICCVSRQQGIQIAQEASMPQFLLQILFVMHAVNGLAFGLHVLFEDMDYSAGIGFPFRDAQPQIEKIAPFSSLIQCPQFGREQFLKHIGCYFTTPLEPPGLNGKRLLLIAFYCKMFSRIDFNFQAHLYNRRPLRFHSIG
jgi:hypothetical protein